MGRWLALTVFAFALMLGCKSKPPDGSGTSHVAGPNTQALLAVTSPRSPWLDYEDLGVDASGVVKSTPAVLFSLYVLNNNGTIRYVQLFDSSSSPSPGAVPRLQFGIPASGGEIIIGNDFWQGDGIGFNNGIAWGISTTKGTFTAATPADHDFMAVYR